MNTEMISLDKITVDDSLQVREFIDLTTVTEYKQLMEEGQLPPIDVFKLGDEYLLAAGWHRLEAAGALTRIEIKCHVHEGDRRDAVLFACGSNAHHGKPLTRNEKRAAVLTMLPDDDWFQWSNARIGRHCGLSAPTVSKFRDHFVNEQAIKSAGSSEGIKNTFDSPRKRTGEGGTTVSFRPPPGRKPKTQAEKNLADLNSALNVLAALPFDGDYAVETFGSQLTDKADAAIEWVHGLEQAKKRAEPTDARHSA